MTKEIIEKTNLMITSMGRETLKPFNYSIRDDRYDLQNNGAFLKSGDQYYQFQDSSFFITTVRIKDVVVKEVYYVPEYLSPSIFLPHNIQHWVKWEHAYVSYSAGDSEYIGGEKWHNLYLPWNPLIPFLNEYPQLKDKKNHIIRVNRNWEIDNIYYEETCNPDVTTPWKRKIYYWDTMFNKVKAYLEGYLEVIPN
jgi:hypothetical protein